MSHLHFNNVIINHKKGNGRFVILVVDNYRQRHPSRNTENSSLIRTLRWWEFSCEFTPTFSLDYKTISTVKNMSEEFAKESFCHTWIVELLLEVKKDTLWKKGQKLFRTKSCPKVGFVENLLCHSSVLHLQSNLKGRSILAKLPLLRFCCWSAVVVRGVERNCKTNLPHGLLLSCTQCINSQSWHEANLKIFLILTRAVKQ